MVYNKEASVLVRIVSVVLVVVMLMSANVLAATGDTAQPFASNNINSYSAYIYPAGSGRVQVCFNINAKATMDSLGVTVVYLYESKDQTSWTKVKTYQSSSYSNMLASNAITHEGILNYQGIGGRYYKAYLRFYANKNGYGEAFYTWTPVRQAI